MQGGRGHVKTGRRAVRAEIRGVEEQCTHQAKHAHSIGHRLE